MNYSQSKLEKMSDFELNKLAAERFLFCDYIINEEGKVIELADYQDVMVGDVHEQVLTAYATYDPCNNRGDCSGLINELILEIKQLHTRINDYNGCIEFSLGGDSFSVIKDDSARAEVMTYILITQYLDDKGNKQGNLEDFSELFFTDVSEATNISPVISKGDRIKVELEGGVVAYCEVKEVVSND